MSRLKTSENLSILQKELSRFRQFLDDDGFRNFLLQNSLKFGLVGKQFFKNTPIVPFNEQQEVLNTFDNAKVEAISGGISISDIAAIDKNGNFIQFPATETFILGSNNWFWVMIEHTYSTQEVGTFSIDSSGNLTGTNGKLTEVLRGQPNFPSRVSFPDSSTNTLEYDVLEVIDDNNAVLVGNFTAETGLKVVVSGTFTPGSTPLTSEKDIFQYDSCKINVIQETTTNTPPSLTDGVQFPIARVKNDGVSVIVQDKRNDVWQTKANYFLKNFDKTRNDLAGVEKIKFDHPASTKDKNLVYLHWAFRSDNWTVNASLNRFTISSGEGGRYHSTADFVDGSFNGWRLYWSDGSYSGIISSIKDGSQINLTLDVLDVDKVSDDGGATFNNYTALVTPNCEEVEVKFDSSNYSTDLPTQTFLFPVNTVEPKCPVLAYGGEAFYILTYRYKYFNDYSQYYNIEENAVGYLNENSFDENGDLKPLVDRQRETYSTTGIGGADYSRIKVLKKNNAYSNVIIGDVPGVDRISLPDLNNSASVYDLVVGERKQYQHDFGYGSTFTLTNDFFINLNKSNAVDGNSFVINLAEDIDLNGFVLRVVTDYVNLTSYQEVVTVTSEYLKLIQRSNQSNQGSALANGTVTSSSVVSPGSGILMRFTYHELSNTWVREIYTSGQWGLVENLQLRSDISALQSEYLGLLKTKTVEIGSWDMETNNLISVTHGLSVAPSSVREISALIRSDNGVNVFSFEIASNFINYGSTTILMGRTDLGLFDSSAFNDGSINRGFVIIRHV